MADGKRPGRIPSTHGRLRKVKVGAPVADPSQALVPELLAAPVAPGATWAAAVTAYLDTLDSPHTRRAYVRALDRARVVLDAAHLMRPWREELHLADLTAGGLAAYRRAVLEADVAPATKAQMLSAVRAFLTWAEAVPTVVLDKVLAPAKGTRRPTLDTLTDDELGAIYAAATTPRDRAIVTVLAGAGLRADEVVGLRVADLHDNGGGLTLHVRGKGQRERDVPVTADVRAVLLDYLAAADRTLRDGGPLFRAHDPGAGKRPTGRPLTTSALAMLVSRLTERAGLHETKAVSPHTFRHSYATRQLRAGVHVEALRRLLGHASLGTTQRYVDHLEMLDLRAHLAPLPSPLLHGVPDSQMLERAVTPEAPREAPLTYEEALESFKPTIDEEVFRMLHCEQIPATFKELVVASWDRDFLRRTKRSRFDVKYFSRTWHRKLESALLRSDWRAQAPNEPRKLTAKLIANTVALEVGKRVLATWEQLLGIGDSDARQRA